MSNERTDISDAGFFLSRPLSVNGYAFLADLIILGSKLITVKTEVQGK